MYNLSMVVMVLLFSMPFAEATTEEIRGQTEIPSQWQPGWEAGKQNHLTIVADAMNQVRAIGESNESQSADNQPMAKVGNKGMGNPGDIILLQLYGQDSDGVLIFTTYYADGSIRVQRIGVKEDESDLVYRINIDSSGTEDIGNENTKN